MKKLSVSLVLIVFAAGAFSQCNMFEVPLSEKVSASQVIFEGEVVSQSSFWNTEHTNIFTSNIIEVYKIFKGSFTSARVEVVTEGGVVDDRMELVDPGLNLSIGETGVFFAALTSVTNSPAAISYNLKFEPVVNAQSFIKYDRVDQVGTTPFKTYTDIKVQLYVAITSQLGQNYRIIKQFDIGGENRSSVKGSLAPSITSFSPTSVTAGTLSVLTINGSGFGTKSGSAKVEFRNADDGGSSYIIANAGNIVSWSDNQIQIKVPYHAGTGTVRITDNMGATVVSGTSVTILYNQITTTQSGIEHRIKFTNENTAGGYTFQYSTNFVSNTAAVASFNRALATWRCATLCNYKMSGTTTGTFCKAADGVNIVSFDNSSCLLGSGILGKTTTYYSSCTSSSVPFWRLDELDVVFSANATGGAWNYGPGPSTGGKYDFETCALHELGHAQLASHIINAPKLMNWTQNKNEDKRTLDPNLDVACVGDNVARSIVGSPCGSPAFVKINAATCSVVGINDVHENELNVTIYPNPFDNSATLQVDPTQLRSTGTVFFSLFDLLGNQVASPIAVNSEKVEMSRNGLSDGVYFYQLRNERGVMASGKLIITNNK